MIFMYSLFQNYKRLLLSFMIIVDMLFKWSILSATKATATNSSPDE